MVCVFRYLLDATLERDAMSSEEDDQATGQLLRLQKDVMAWVQ
jgi:hypothetical protein